MENVPNIVSSAIYDHLHCNRLIVQQNYTGTVQQCNPVTAQQKYTGTVQQYKPATAQRKYTGTRQNLVDHCRLQAITAKLTTHNKAQYSE